MKAELTHAQEAMPPARRAPYIQDTEDTVSSSCFVSLFSFGSFRSSAGSRTAAKRDGTNRKPSAKHFHDLNNTSLSPSDSPGSNYLSTSTPGARCILCGAGKCAVNDRSSECELCGTPLQQRMTAASWSSGSSASGSSP